MEKSTDTSAGSSSFIARLSLTVMSPVAPSSMSYCDATKPTESGGISASPYTLMSSSQYVVCPPVERAPKAQPCTSVRPSPSSGAPLPISLRVKSAKGNSKYRQPEKSSLKVTVCRSASSVVDPGFRLSRRSMKRSVPLLFPYSQKLNPLKLLQSCGVH